MRAYICKKQSGFTLLELIVVVAVLGLITSLATDYAVNDANQKRFEVTKSRLAEIKYAIVGDVSRSINGQPLLSGFVYDVGRLPLTLSELIYPCRDSANIGVANASGPIADETSCLSKPGNQWEANWDGPYLKNLQTVQLRDLDEVKDGVNDRELTFQDGWGNSMDIDSDDGNLGWIVTTGAYPDDLVVQSKGLDGEVGSSGDPYEKDYPELQSLVYSSEVRMIQRLKGASGSLTIPIYNAASTTKMGDYCLVIHDGSNTYISGLQGANIAAGDVVSFTFSHFENDDGSGVVSNLPKGNYTYGVYGVCPSVGSAPATVSTLKLFIKSNGVFASLYELI